MSSNRQETIADIVREMRKRAQEVYEGQAGYPESWEDQMNDDEIREIADRIEAAAKLEREVGAEKMRENLGEVMHKKYTAQKIREMEAIVASGDMGPMTRENVALMLKQAAEMLDRLDEDIWRESTREKSSAVGDAAKMREACENIAEYAKTAACHIEDTHLLSYINQIESWAEAAISSPPRNCDVGTAEEQSDRFDKFCYSYNSCSKCPVKSLWNSSNRQKQLREIIRCEIIWSQMPYEEVK